MKNPPTQMTRLLRRVVDHIDIPEWLYQMAADRHLSLANWLKREGSTVAGYDPDIRPQGSFRFGTVNRPLRPDDVFDLDNVCLLRKLGKGTLSQKQLKELYGAEVKAYAKAHNMLAPVTEKNRCWRLEYADDVNFHLDTLPCVPEDPAVVSRLIQVSVSPELALRAVAITDKRNANYEAITPLWPSSNPRGFAAWFEQRAALGRDRAIAEGSVRATIEEVPPYGWKTTLQQSIQLIKRHRDVVFRDNPELAPISMIITNLAAHAYDGNTDLAAALGTIVDVMAAFVREQRPRVPNPADPAEDYADKWNHDSRLEPSFWQWHGRLKRDLAALASSLAAGSVGERVTAVFRVELTQDELRPFDRESAPPPATPKPTPLLVVPSAARPWGG